MKEWEILDELFAIIFYLNMENVLLEIGAISYEYGQ